MVYKKQLIRNIVRLHEKLETKTGLTILDKKQSRSQVIRNIIKVVSRRNIYCITNATRMNSAAIDGIELILEV